MATIIETDFTREDENEDISLIEEKLAKLFKGYKPTFHPALEILRLYPISSLGISRVYFYLILAVLFRRYNLS